jgi:cytochrome c peroxidase
MFHCAKPPGGARPARAMGKSLDVKEDDVRLSATPRALVGVLASAVIALAIGCGSREPAEIEPEIPELQTRSWEAPPGWAEMSIPADNPMTVEKVGLGAQLYFDPRISGDGARNCYSCHVCEKGLTDGRQTALGAFGKPLTRSSPTLWNVGYHTEFYWDGRAKSLEAQALAAWRGGNMGANPDSIAAVLNAIPAYKTQFQSVFGTDVTPDAVAKALAAYMRTIFCADTAFDRWQAGDETAVSDDAKKGWELFTGKAACATCHVGNLLTDNLYHNVGVDMDKPQYDLGRFKVTNEKKDTGAFKTPTLRDITRTAPYFHNGRVGTLKEAVMYMASGGLPSEFKDPKLKRVEISAAELNQLLAFLQTLECPCDMSAPALP